MTLAEKIKNLNWVNFINKLKDILKGLDDKPSGGGGIESISGDYVDNTDPLNPILEDPRPYKVYTALLSQSGTDAPVATVLENTLGVTPTYGYSSVGEYTLISNGFFTEDKKYLFQGLVSDIDDLVTSLERLDDNTIRINSVTLNGVPTDELMYGQAFIEIRVYN
jgi:hypothetical protein